MFVLVGDQLFNLSHVLHLVVAQYKADDYRVIAQLPCAHYTMRESPYRQGVFLLEPSGWGEITLARVNSMEQANKIVHQIAEAIAQQRPLLVLSDNAE